MEPHTEPAKDADKRMPSEAEIIACKSVKLLFLIAEQSSLSPREFWKALPRLANNEAIMRSALNNGTWDYGLSNPIHAQKPIEIE